MDDLQIRRIANNEARFRAINERVTDTIERRSNEPVPRIMVVCECAFEDCREMIDVSMEQYRHARSDARWFIVLPDHVVPEAEVMVEACDNHWIIQKLGVGADVARQRR